MDNNSSDGIVYSIVSWLADGVFRTWWFDPFLATISFGVFMNWYWYHERFHAVSYDPNFQSSMMLYSFDEILLGPSLSSGIVYWIGIYFWIHIVPPAANGDIPDGIPTTLVDCLYLTMEVISGIVLYDAIFFFVHWGFHAIPVLRQFHARHHNHTTAAATITTQPQKPGRSSGVESRDVLRHSIVDGSLQVLVNILVQRHTCWMSVKTRLARSLHNILVIWMLTESHSAAPTPYIWRKYFVGVREHYKHHNHNVHHGKQGTTTRYQQFFGYLDDWRLNCLMASRRRQRPPPNYTSCTSAMPNKSA